MSTPMERVLIRNNNVHIMHVEVMKQNMLLFVFKFFVVVDNMKM